ncbi:MAG: SMC-Scp complex subunit ScpB [Candidatus Omnitrophota bacterium]|jgi:segregation and condensation protein B
MERDEIKRIVEALLFVSDRPLAPDTLRDVLKDAEIADIKASMDDLNKEYAATGRSFIIKEIAGGYQMMTDPIYSKWITELYKRPPDKLRGPALETLAIIAYKQPITRNQIEAIRGVNVDGVINTLEDRVLIKIKGRAEGPGRPILYGTTNEFLIHFGLKSLDELPNLKEFQEADLDFIKEMEKTQVIDKGTGKLEEDKPAAADAGPVQESSGEDIPSDTASEQGVGAIADKEKENGPEEIPGTN